MLVFLSSRFRSLLRFSSSGLMFSTSLYILCLNAIPLSLDTATSGMRYIPLLVVNTSVYLGWFTLRLLRQYIQRINNVSRTNSDDLSMLLLYIALCPCGPRDQDRHSATRPVFNDVQQDAVIHVEPYPPSPLLVSRPRIKYPSYSTIIILE